LYEKSALAVGLFFVVLICATLWRRFHIEHTDAQYLALSSARTVAFNIDTHLGGLKDLLSGLSGAISTNPDYIDANDTLLRRIQSELPKSIANIFLLAPDGSNIGSSVGKHASAAYRDYFQKALAGNRLVVGFPIRSRSDLGWVIPVAQPVSDDSAKILAVLAIAIFARSLQDLIGTYELPKGAVVGIATENEIEIALFSIESTELAPDIRRVGSAARQFQLAEGTEVMNLHNNLTRTVGFSRTRRAPWLATVGLPVQDRLVSGTKVP